MSAPVSRIRTPGYRPRGVARRTASPVHSAAVALVEHIVSTPYHEKLNHRDALALARATQPLRVALMNGAV